MERSIRAAAVLSSALAFSAQDAAAQDYAKVYVSCEYRFAAIFPSTPMVKDTTYTTRTGASLPAKQFYNERGQDLFSVTIVKFPTGPSVDEQAIAFAADTLRKRGEVRFQADVIYDPGMPGKQLNLSQPNGRQLRASVYMVENHLTITEADSAPGDFSALQFEQSIALIEGNGLDRDQNTARGEALKRYPCR